MRSSRLAILLMSTVAVVSIISASIAPPAIAQDESFQFNIPSEDLDSALKDFARASHQQITFDVAAVKGKQAPALIGPYSASAGLEKVLAGSGFVARRIRPGLFVVSMPAEKAASAGDQPATEQVVVTGSRIAQAGYNSPSPVAITAAPEIARTGESNLYDVLNRSTQFGVGSGPGASATSYTGEIGASFINLRGLGTNRTLVLVNGQRRVSGSSQASAVDLSTIPAGMVQRIEVVTGGAAAVYGADAVSGAVNVILKDEADGLEFSARQGISGHGDAESFTLGVLAGGAIGARGRITVGLSYNHDDPLFDKQRAATALTRFALPNPAYTGQPGQYVNVLFTDIRFPNATTSGSFTIGGNRYTYNNGVLRPTQNNVLINGPLSFYATGGDGFNLTDYNGLRPSTSIGAALVHFTYDLDDDVTLTTDLQFANTIATQRLQPLFGYAYHITRDNPYLPAPVAALMDANNVTTLTVGRTDQDQGLNAHKVNRESYTGVVKLDGKITPSISWSTFAQYGRFNNNDTFTNERVISRFNEALDVIQGPSGPQCRSATAVANGCAPLNIFGANVATPEALNYFHTNPTTITTNTQTVLGAQVSGNGFELPAGPVAFSAGAEYRKETTDVLADKQGCTGQLFFNHGCSLSGRFEVAEQYGEVLVPLLADLPFAKTLQFNAAARESEYPTTGNTFTWKAGLVYAPVDDVRFRVTQSRSVRAPNLSELFNSGASSASSYFDPCSIGQITAAPNRAANCHALGIPAGFVDPKITEIRYINTIGNPNLHPETSDSTTFGIVLQPSFLDGFSASIDYYNIQIKGAINTIPPNDILTGCYDGTTPNALLCSQVVRGANLGILFIKESPLNTGALVTRGFDLAADYHFNGGQIWNDPLRLGLSFAGSYDLRNAAVVDASHPENTLQYAGSELDPKFRGNLTASADAGQWSLNWTFRYISPTKLSLNYPPFLFNDLNLSARLYNDVYVGYDYSDRLSLGVGVNNLLDVYAPGIADGTQGSSLYDNVGRYFFLNAKFKTE